MITVKNGLNANAAWKCLVEQFYALVGMSCVM